MPKNRQGVKSLIATAKDLINQSVWLAFADVTEVDETNYKVRAIVYPDQIETNWIDIGTLGVGDGVLVGGLPEVGTTILVGILGDFNEVIMLCQVKGEDDETPTFSNKKDFFIKPRHGGLIKFTADGITIDTEQDVTINADNVTVNSDNVLIGGTSGGKKVLTEDFETKYNSDMSAILLHTHGVVPPDPTLTTIGSANTGSTKVKAVP